MEEEKIILQPGQKEYIEASETKNQEEKESLLFQSLSLGYFSSIEQLCLIHKNLKTKIDSVIAFCLEKKESNEDIIKMVKKTYLKEKNKRNFNLNINIDPYHKKHTTKKNIDAKKIIKNMINTKDQKEINKYMKTLIDLARDGNCEACYLLASNFYTNKDNFKTMRKDEVINIIKACNYLEYPPLYNLLQELEINQF